MTTKCLIAAIAVATSAFATADEVPQKISPNSSASSALLTDRANTVIASMNAGLTMVSATWSESDPEDTTTTDGASTVPATSVSGNCNASYADGSTCETYAPGSCNNPTAVAGCQDNTFSGSLCGTQNGNHVSCSEDSCKWKTWANCTQAAGNCDGGTYAANCQSWTHARYGCQTDTPFCQNATIAHSGCGGRTTSSPSCKDDNTYTRNCVNTSSGNGCSSVGACVTFGPQCISVAGSPPGMCGAYSVAAGNRCHVQQETTPTTADSLAAGATMLVAMAGIAALGRAFIV